MEKNIKNQVIKSITAFVCVICLCVATVLSVNKITDAKVNVAKASGYPSQEQKQTNDTITEIAADGSIIEITAQDDTDTTSTDENGQTSDVDSSASDTSGDKTSQASDKNTTSKSSNSVPATKAEIINYCNTALNKVKSSKAGYNKHAVMKINGETTGSIGSLLKVVEKDKKTTMKKGSDLTDDFPAAGYSWSSKLRESDVSSATIKTNGNYYEITLKLGKEVNPAKGESSSYGRVMSVIDANGAKDMVPGIKSITMTYHDGYVYAKIDSKTKNVVSAEFAATADISANISILGNITAKDILSTETFTNFVW